MSESRSTGATPGQPLAIAASIIFIGNLVSRVLGLIREQLAASRFGAGNDIAAFTVADNLNTLLFDLIVNGMLQAAIVPVLALLVLGGVATADLRRVSGTVVIGATGIAVVVALTGIVLAPSFISLVTALTGNQNARGDATRDLAIDNLRLILLSLPLLAAATVLTASLYAMQRPGGPALGATMRNAAVVLAILLFSGSSGVKSMAVGVVVGAALMLGVMLAAVHNHQAMPVLQLDFRDQHVRRMADLALPVFLGFLVSSAVVILDRNLAWGAEEDAIGAMRYATTLVQLVLGLVAAAVSIAALPRLAHAHASDRDGTDFNRELGRALRLVTVLMLPAVAMLGFFARPIVDLLFEHGATDQQASRLIVVALLLYLPGHLLAAYDQVLIFAFYARQNTKTPVLVGVVAAVAYAATAPILASHYEMAGLVVANTLQLGLHTVIMIWLCRKQFGAGAFRDIGPLLGRAVGATIGTALMAGAAWLVVQRFSGLTGFGQELLAVVMPMLVGGVVYLLLCRTMGIRELDDILDLLKWRVRPPNAVTPES